MILMAIALILLMTMNNVATKVDMYGPGFALVIDFACLCSAIALACA